MLTIVFGFLLGAESLRQPSHTAGDLRQESESSSEELNGIRGSAFLDLEAADLDKAHAGLWKALASSKIKYEGLSLNEDPVPTDLSMSANGVPLPWDSSRRPGRVNPIRLVLALRWERFEEVVQKGGKIQMYLKTGGDYRKPDKTIPPCQDGNTSNCVTGGFAAAYFQVPEKSDVTVELNVKVPGEAALSHSWDIETADAGSGDAQAWINFLYQNHSEYLRKWTGFASDNLRFTRALEDEKFAVKELTIHDLDSSNFRPNLETNGFEIDSTGALKQPLDDLMYDMERKDVKQVFTTEYVTFVKGECYINTTEDLMNLSHYIDGDTFTGGLCTNDLFYDGPYPSSTYNSPRLNGTKLLSLLTCQKGKSAVSCDGKPVNFSTELPTPLKLTYEEKLSPREVNTTRAAAMHTGAALALMAPEQREEVWKQLSGEDVVMGSRTVRVLGEVDELVEVMRTAIDLSEKLVASMEKASEKWWKSKTGTETKGACFSMNFRHTRLGMRGLPIAHVDATSVTEWFKEGGAFPASALKGFEEKLGMNVSEALKHAVVTFNEWVNAGSDPIHELPLTILDTSTLDAEDVETAWIQSSLDSMSLRFSPKQRWYYKELARGEGYRFITSPHEGPEGTRYEGTPHSAFRFIRKDGVDADRPRQSYEFRCILIDPNWTTPNTNITGLAVEPSDEKEIVKAAAGEIMAGIMAGHEAVMDALVDTEDFQEQVEKAEDLFNSTAE